MTNDEIDKLEAGPEINALVAEAMGKLRRNGSWYEVESPRGGWISGFHGKKDAMNWLGQQFLFSKNISAAWEVVENWVRDRHGSYGEIELRSEGLGGAIWKCGFGIYESVAPTAPLAICRAALKAKLVDNQTLTK